MTELCKNAPGRMGSKAARLVWAFVFLGLASAACTLYLVHRVLAGIQTERSRVSAVADATRAFGAAISLNAAEQQTELNQLLAGESVEDADGIARMKILLRDFKATSAGEELKPSVAALETFLNNLLRSRDRCAVWELPTAASKSRLAFETCARCSTAPRDNSV
jgi:hypothetical protein